MSRETKMAKNYKDYPLRDFGYSDIASLVCVYFDNDDNSRIQRRGNS